MGELYATTTVTIELSHRNGVGGYFVMATNATVSEWMDGCLGTCAGVSVTLYLVGTIENTVFAQILSIFTCTLWMTRGLTLLILVHMVKHQGQMWHFVYKTCV